MKKSTIIGNTSPVYGLEGLRRSKVAIFCKLLSRFKVVSIKMLIKLKIVQTLKVDFMINFQLESQY